MNNNELSAELERAYTLDAITGLDAIPRGDNEASHTEAETLLMEYLGDVGLQEVADAYQRCADRCDFWYA